MESHETSYSHPWPLSHIMGAVLLSGSLLLGPVLPTRAEADTPEGALRLQDGPTAAEGRVEVYRNGQWGTVCDDYINVGDAAAVVCRQLGYTGEAKVFGEAHYGPGSGPIWMDDVRCTGTETRLVDCPHNSTSHNCDHSEDVGVACSAQ